MLDIEQESLLPRENLQNNYIVSLMIYKSIKNLLLCMRENAIPFNKEVEEFMMRMKLESHAFYRNSLLSIYGEKVMPYLLDLVIMVEGICRGYLELIILQAPEIDLSYVAAFILKE